MKTCAEYKEQIWLSVYGESEPDAHIRQCPECLREMSELSAMIRKVRDTVPAPELGGWEKENLSRSVLLTLKEEKTGWRKLPAFFRMPSAVLTASLLLLFSGWFVLNTQKTETVKTASVSKSEEIQIIENYELISNLDMLEEMEYVEKVVETVDRKKYGGVSIKRILPVRKADYHEKQV